MLLISSVFRLMGGAGGLRAPQMARMISVTHCNRQRRGKGRKERGRKLNLNQNLW